MATLAQRVARTLEDPETLGAKWNSGIYMFPDGSAGAWEWEPAVTGPAFHFRVFDNEEGR